MPTNTVRVGIALGANLGDRAAALRNAARSLLKIKGVSGPLLGSQMYETEPIGTSGDVPWFLNAVVEVNFTGDLEDLLDALLRLEQEMGRPATRERNSSRAIDLDLLYAGEVQISSARLQLPHPRLIERRFVLQPLAEIRPGLLLPGIEQTIAALLSQVRATGAVESTGQSLRLPPGLHPLIGELRGMKRSGRRIAALTAYDYPTARLLDEAGIDIILVGDSLGMVVLGYSTTSSVTMNDILHHLKAVRRGVKKALVVADLPFGSYDSLENAVENAWRLVEAGADAVKLEGGSTRKRQIQAIVDQGIPYMAHLGMLPQSVTAKNGYRLHGKTTEEAKHLVEDAACIEAAGAFATVLELVKPEVAAAISASLTIPTIGIGSGTRCDGEILVSHDLFGLFPWFVPKHVKWGIRLGDELQDATRRYINETRVFHA